MNEATAIPVVPAFSGDTLAPAGQLLWLCAGRLSAVSVFALPSAIS